MIQLGILNPFSPFWKKKSHFPSFAEVKIILIYNVNGAFLNHTFMSTHFQPKKWGKLVRKRANVQIVLLTCLPKLNYWDSGYEVEK